MFPKGPCVKDLVLRVILLGGGGIFRKWGLVEGIQDIGVTVKTLEGDCGIPASSPLSLFCFLS
jgi:hypothetical protein